MELLFTLMLFLQATGLMPYVFYYGNDEPNEWDKEDIKVVGIMQLPINIAMWIALKSPQAKISRLFLFLHMVSMSSFIVSILIFT